MTSASSATVAIPRLRDVQVVIALVVTPEGFPLAYEVLPGNPSDKTTLRAFLKKIEESRDCGSKADRIWLMDRGIPTEEVLAEMRASVPPIQYLVGTPKGRLSALAQPLYGRRPFRDAFAAAPRCRGGRALHRRAPDWGAHGRDGT